MSTSDNSSAWSLALQAISKDAGSFTFQSLPGFIDLFLSDSGISGTNLPFFLFSCIPIVYGSLHFLGWDSQFPSATERILWRIATVGVASSGGAITVILVVFFSNFLKSKAPRFNTALIVIGALLFTIILYVLLRVPYRRKHSPALVPTTGIICRRIVVLLFPSLVRTYVDDYSPMYR